MAGPFCYSLAPIMIFFKTATRSIILNNTKQINDIWFRSPASTVTYDVTNWNKDGYDKKITFIDSPTTSIPFRALLYYKSDWSQWEYILRRSAGTEDTTDSEVRDIKYVSLGTEVNVSVLFYRKDTTDNMNDVVQFWRSAIMKIVSLVFGPTTLIMVTQRKSAVFPLLQIS